MGTWFRNSPVLLTFGNAPTKTRRKRAMAKTKKKGMPPALKRYWAQHRAKKAGRAIALNAPMARKSSSSKAGYKVARRVKHLVHNPPGGTVNRWFRIPTVPELGWSFVGSVGLPVGYRFLTNLIPIQQVKEGPGNIAFEFAAGNVIASAVGSRFSPVGGNILFILNLARAESRTAFLLSGGMMGLADGVESPGLQAYVDEAMGAVGDAGMDATMDATTDEGVGEGGMDATDETQLIGDGAGEGGPDMGFGVTEEMPSFSAGAL